MSGRLGRLPNDPSKPRLRIALAPSASGSADWLSKVPSYPMYGNDTIGDCTCAAAGHMLQAWTAYASAEVTVPDDAVLSAYEAVSGYDPATGANDNGAVMQDVLSYWRKTGIGGHKILAFAQIDHTNPTQVRAAIEAFGGIYVGVNFPDSAMQQFDQHQPWTVVARAQIEGGHAIHVGAYTGAELTCVTWGALQGLDDAWWAAYVEEAWVVVTQDWIAANGSTPAGETVAALGASFTALTGEADPFPQPTPTPAPAPAPQPVPPTPGPAPVPAPSPDVTAALTELDGYAKSGYASDAVAAAIGVIHNALGS